jgi:hypothetical protein
MGGKRLPAATEGHLFMAKPRHKLLESISSDARVQQFMQGWCGAPKSLDSVPKMGKT